MLFVFSRPFLICYRLVDLALLEGQVAHTTPPAIVPPASLSSSKSSLSYSKQVPHHIPLHLTLTNSSHLKSFLHFKQGMVLVGSFSLVFSSNKSFMNSITCSLAL